jgi:hypothetical protein
VSTVAEIRDGSPRFQITIGGDARFQIESETTRRKFQLRDGYESGGVLFGTVNEAGALIEIATGPGNGFQLQLGEMNVTLADVLGDEQARILGDYICGSWHNHPRGALTEPPEPSDQDRRHWRDLLERPGYRGDAVVGLIVTEGRSVGWSTPRIFAWVTRRRDGEILTERVGEIHAR